MSTISAVVFDLDGLMFNTEELSHQTMKMMLQRRGITEIGDVIDRMMGRRAEDAFRDMIDTCGLKETHEELQQESDEIYQRLLDEKL